MLKGGLYGPAPPYDPVVPGSASVPSCRESLQKWDFFNKIQWLSGPFSPTTVEHGLDVGTQNGGELAQDAFLGHGGTSLLQEKYMDQERPV